MSMCIPRFHQVNGRNVNINTLFVKEILYIIKNGNEKKSTLKEEEKNPQKRNKRRRERAINTKFFSIQNIKLLL